MSGYGYQHFNVLLGHMIRFPNFCRAIVTTPIDGVWFSQELGGQWWQSAAYSAIKDYFSTYQSAPDIAAFVTSVYQVIDNFVADPNQNAMVKNEVVGFVRHFLPTVTERSRPLAEAVKRYILETCYFKSAAAALVQDAQSSGGLLDDLSNRLRGLEGERRSMFGSTERNRSLLERFQEGASEDIKRSKFGIDWLDARFVEGLGPCSACGAALLAGQGCGKTTMGNEITVSQTQQNKPGLIVVAEQGVDQDYMRNLIARASGLSTVSLVKTNDNIQEACALEGKDYDLAMNHLQAMTSNLHTFDFVLEDHKPEEWEVEVARLAEASTANKLEVVYIDWAGMLADRILVQGYQGHKLTDKRDALDFLAGRINEVAARYELFITIAHQMAPATVTKGPTFESTQYDAMDSRSFTAPLRYCINIGPEDPRTGCQLISMPKCRNDAKMIGDTREVVRLDGPCARFHKADGFEVKGKRIRRDNFKEDDHDVPGDDENLFV